MTGKVLEALCALLVIVVYSAVMFVPTYVAFYRRHEHRLAIGIVNFLLGWTGIGWAGTMVWALTEETFHPLVAGTQIGPQPDPTPGTGD